MRTKKTIVAAAIALALSVSPLASGQTVEVPGEREISPAEALQIATHEARQAGQQGELVMDVARSNFARAAAVTEGKSPSEAVETSQSPQITEWWKSPSYLVVITAVKGGSFILNAPTPRGATAPTGTVLSLIIDANDGVVDGRTLGPTVPLISELGPTITERVAAVGTATGASVHSVRPNPYGIVLGHLLVNHKPTVGWHVLLGHNLRHPAAVLVTTANGRFGYKFKQDGRYVIAAQRPHGGLCGERSLIPRKDTEKSIVVSC